MNGPTGSDPWDDDRLAAAFAARFGGATVPGTSTDGTIERLRRPVVRRSRFDLRLAAAAIAVLVVAVGSVGLGAGLIPGIGPAGMVRDGPTPELRTFDNGEFAFDFPATWLVYDASASFSGGSSIAFLGTQPVEPRCGDEHHVDTNCVYEQRLEPGDVRLFIGTGGYRGGTVLDRPDIENGTSQRIVVGGMPAIRDTFDIEPDSYYREDLSVYWSIAYPDTLTNVVRIELRAREDPDAADAVIPATLETMDALIASFRYQAAGEPSAMPSDAPPAMVLDLPIRSVVDAIAIRDAGVDDREIAVSGWYSSLAPIPCPAPRTSPVSPVEPNCPDQFTVLMENPEILTTVSENGREVHGPTGPNVQIDLDHLDRSWEPRPLGLGAVQPIELVLVGHFDDRRSALCPDAVRDACRDRFVVDRVAFVGDQEISLSIVDQVDGGAVSRPDDVATTLHAAVPGAEILSMVTVGGEIGLQGVEPAINTFAPLQGNRAIWVVRVLVPCPPRVLCQDRRMVTYLVIDGGTEVLRVDADGGTTPVGGTPALPSAAPTPLGGPVVVELTSEVGSGLPRPLVTVVDHAGIIAAVREVGPDDRAMGSGTDIFTRDPDVDGRYRLSWIGSLCDQAITVTIVLDVSLIVVDPGVQDTCRLKGVTRELVLDFTRSVDTTGVELAIDRGQSEGAS